MRSLLRRFRRDADGATAVEFAFVALPFLALFLALIELGLVFFTSQALEAGVEHAARFVLTGQAQAADWLDPKGPGDTRSDAQRKVDRFRKEICSKTGALLDCAKLMVDVKTIAAFKGASLAVPLKEGAVDPGQLTFTPGKGGDIVIARAMYVYPVLIPLLGPGLANLGPGKRLLVGVATFRNEPF